MDKLTFGSNGLVHLPTKYNGEVTLSKHKWETICCQPERTWYKFNCEKVATTLVAPDEVRHHTREPNQLFYYKQFSQYRFDERITVPAAKHFCYFAVVIDTSTGKVCTVFPLDRPKKGKEYKGEIK